MIAGGRFPGVVGAEWIQKLVGSDWNVRRADIGLIRPLKTVGISRVRQSFFASVSFKRWAFLRVHGFWIQIRYSTSKSNSHFLSQWTSFQGPQRKQAATFHNTRLGGPSIHSVKRQGHCSIVSFARLPTSSIDLPDLTKIKLCRQSYFDWHQFIQRVLVFDPNQTIVSFSIQ